MDDNTFIRYDSLGILDSRVTCVTSLDNFLFLGNSYGDIRVIKGQESQILHNHHGEITVLVCKRCYRTSREDTLYLLSGTSIGNVYLHLVFLDKLSGSRILYKFVTGYCVFSICPHPEFDIFNFKRLTNRLTVDFTKDVSKDSDNWKELPSLSLSVESFILSLSNGRIYLVHNCGFNSNPNSNSNFNKNSPKEKENTKMSSTDLVNEDKEKFVIMCISLYCPYTNMKMNWHERYISWIDREGFYVYLLPNFVSIIYIPSKYFGNYFHKKDESLGFREKIKKTEKIHYLYNIIDNSELYVSTEESDISPSGDISARSSISVSPKTMGNILYNDDNGNNVENHSNSNENSRNDSDSSTSGNFTNNSNNDEDRNSKKNTKESKENQNGNDSKNKNRKIHMKRLKNRMVNHKYLRNNNSYGTMSRFLSDSVLVGCNNTLLCIKLLEDSDRKFREYHNLLLSTFPNKEVIGYKDMRKSISCPRSSSVVRGYIDFKLVFPEHFNVLHVLYSSQSQFNLIVLDEGVVENNVDNNVRNDSDSSTSGNFTTGIRNTNDKNKNNGYCYQFEKYNRNGSVTQYKLNLPDQIKRGTNSVDRKSKIINMIFSLNSSGSDNMSLISLVHCEEISVRYLKGDIVSENIIIGATSRPGTTNKEDLYVCVKDSLIRINYCSNYFNLLKYYITNCYNQNIVVNHFKTNLISMLNSNIFSTTGEFKSCEGIGSSNQYEVEHKYQDKEKERLKSESSKERPQVKEKEKDKVDEDDTHDKEINYNNQSIIDYNRGMKYLLDYIRVFVDYLLESKCYEGFKVILRVLNRCGKLGDFLGSLFTDDVKVKLEVLGFYDRLVEDLVDILDDGNSLMYLQVVGWKLNNKVYNNLLNKIKTILVDQIYYLYNLFLASELASGVDTENINAETNFPNGSYFDVLLLLNDLNSKSEVELRDLYNMLYQFLVQTACQTGQENILKYKLSDRLTKNIDNENSDKHGIGTYDFENYDPLSYLKFLNSFDRSDGSFDFRNFNNYSGFDRYRSDISSILYYDKKTKGSKEQQNSTDKNKEQQSDNVDNSNLNDVDNSNTVEINVESHSNYIENEENENVNLNVGENNLENNNNQYDLDNNLRNDSDNEDNKYKDKNRLELYFLENEELYNRLLCLKYYRKRLNEKLVDANTRGVVFPGNPGSGMARGPESWYIQRAVVNCNICNSQRVVYDKVVNKLTNRVRGKMLKQKELGSPTLLYFPCRHLVHEKCQVRLINRVIELSEVDTSITWTNEPGVYSSNELLNTCLTCLTK